VIELFTIDDILEKIDEEIRFFEPTPGLHNKDLTEALVEIGPVITLCGLKIWILKEQAKVIKSRIKELDEQLLREDC